MIQIQPDAVSRIAPLFAGWEESMIWSCLQGRMGRAWADRRIDPLSAQIVVADFCFFAGVPAEDLVRNAAQAFLIMVPAHPGWERLIEAVYPHNSRRVLRYATKKEGDVFQRGLLRAYQKMLPEDYSLRPMDEALYRQAACAQWSKDLVSQFPTYAAYRQEGLGFAAVYRGELVGGASSYTVYHGGLEIEVDVREDHRRNGVARACAASLILACLERGLYPCWDAANPESLHLAESLGYRLDQAYPAYEVTLS